MGEQPSASDLWFFLLSDTLQFFLLSDTLARESLVKEAGKAYEKENSMKPM